MLALAKPIHMTREVEMTARRSTGRRILVLVAIVATTSALIVQARSWDKIAPGSGGEDLGVVPETAQTIQQEDGLIRQLEQAHEAARGGDVETAVTLFRQVSAAAFPWHAWAATSGLVATYRMNADFSAAFAVTAQVSRERPHLQGLMAIWDGDTAVLAGDLPGARAYYLKASQDPSSAVVAAALNQLARLALLAGKPREAAELKRELMHPASSPTFAGAAPR